MDALFSAYRDACIVPEASPNFMPRLWRKIEGRQSFFFLFGRMASGFVTAAAAAALILATFLFLPHPGSSLVYRATYLDALIADQEAETLQAGTVTVVDTGADLGLERDLL